MDLRDMFAFNLRRLRHGRGLSQEAAAYEAGINRSYMSQLERGMTYVGLEIIGKLAEALEADPAEFLRPPPKSRGKTKRS